MNHDAGRERRSRREFLVSAGRSAALAAIAAVGAVLAWRRLAGKADADCARRSPCGGCPSFAQCELPRATAAKVTLREKSGNG
jgi:hypothetical protein